MLAIKTYELVSDEQKIVFDYDDKLKGFGYTLYVMNHDLQWKRISNSGNPLIRGASFNLYPAQIETEMNPLELIVSGTKNDILTDSGNSSYTWKGIISLTEENKWIHIKLQTMCENTILLQMVDGFEPEIMVDMGELPPYDRGDHVWFKTNINNPTKWNDEAYGNDFPALYYFDSYHQFDIMMFFDMTAMSWMNRNNIARFLNYRCGFRRYYKPSPAFGLGLYADGFSGRVFPKGEQTFEYFIKIRRKTKATTEAIALKELVNNCLELIPAKTKWPANATGWEDFAEKCAIELMDDQQCWDRNDQYDDYILNYVNGYSPAWHEAFAAKNLKIDFRANPCIDSASWIAFPLSILNTLKENKHFSDLLNRIMRFIRQYVKYQIKAVNEPRVGISGTWQYVYILEQIWQVGYLNKDEEIVQYVLNEVDSHLIPLSKNVNYLYPLAFDVNTLRKYGNGDGYSIGGLYAFFMFNLYKTTNDNKYMDEAQRAIRPLIQLPINSLSQEVFLFGLGVQAASWIYRETNDPQYLEIYEYLLSQNLRMMYWFDDNSKEEYKDYNIFAMFQACTPIIYPAFFENIECLARIASTLDVHEPHKGLLRIFNHARKNNFYMFPKCLPENKHMSNLLHIPFENLGVLEDEKTGWIGQEIYGSGQVFNAYLMWEAFGKSSDRDVMVINLNNYKIFNLDTVKEMELHFIVYNPEATNKSVEILVPIKNKIIPLILKPDESVYLKVE